MPALTRTSRERGGSGHHRLEQNPEGGMAASVP